MSRKKEEHEKEPNHERWLVSYADFITLLFAVFVTLYAMSQVDKAKVAKVIASTNEAFGVSKSTSAPAFNIIDTDNLIPLPNLSKKSSTEPRPPTGDFQHKSKKMVQDKDLVDQIFKSPDHAPAQEGKETTDAQRKAMLDAEIKDLEAEQKMLADQKQRLEAERETLLATEDNRQPSGAEQKAQTSSQRQTTVAIDGKHEVKVRANVEQFKKIEGSIEAFLKKEGAEDKVTMNITSRGLVISLKDTAFFDSGKATVRPGSMFLLDNITNAIAKYSNSIRIEGHTDNVPIKTPQFQSNWELSTARATNIVRYLIDARNFPADRLSAVGYGEYRPVADNSTEEGRQKNRRVDIVVLSNAGEQGEPGRSAAPPPE